jgi:hypothetical protein
MSAESASFAIIVIHKGFVVFHFNASFWTNFCTQRTADAFLVINFWPMSSPIASLITK